VLVFARDPHRQTRGDAWTVAPGGTSPQGHRDEEATWTRSNC
jgi:hypothetical protein